MVSPDFYALLDDMRKTLASSLERVNDKLDDVKKEMATHREVDEIKQRMSKNEALIELIREEAAKRSEVTRTLAELRTSLREEIDDLKEQNQDLTATIVDLQGKQGKLPGWLWSAIISAAMNAASWVFLHPK